MVAVSCSGESLYIPPVTASTARPMIPPKTMFPATHPLTLRESASSYGR